MADENRLEDFSFMKKFLGSDCSILKDLLAYREHDVHKLLRRLETLLRNNAKSTIIDASCEEIHRYLKCLVDVYFSCSESIKLSRAVEKLWQPYQDLYQEWIKNCFQKNLDVAVHSDSTDNHSLVRVSVLIEQNMTVQSVFADNLESYLCWAARRLTCLTEILPSELRKEDSLCLYSVVKICLQVFQTCSSTISTQAWSEDVGTYNKSVSMATRRITEKLVHILKSKGYSVDCVLLSGTATALLLNTLPHPDQAVSMFNTILHIMLNTGDFTLLWNKSSSSSGFISEKLSLVTVTELGSLSLIRGCVACGSKAFLSYWSQSTDGNTRNMSEQSLMSNDALDSRGMEDQDCIFIKLFCYICVLCEGDITIHYHAFQVLLLWFSRLTKLNSSLESSVLNNFTFICESTLHLVFLNMDSPIEDVPEAVVDIFGHLLTVWKQYQTQKPDLPQFVLQKIMNSHWYVKGKYRLLATLLKYTDTDQVISEYPQIQNHLLQCLMTNHLTSAATNVYKAFLQEIRKCHPEAENQAASWKETWLPLVVNGLVAQDSLLRYNMSLHWVPATFKLLQSTSDVLQKHLSVAMATPDAGVCRTRLLHAWIVVTKTIRTLFGTSDLTDTHVLEAFYSGDEDVRSEAIALVCSTLKKAECISETEVHLLIGCLPHNIKIDSAPFRQHLGSNLKKLLVRLRDSCITMLKDDKTYNEALVRSVIFVDWFHRLCIGNLLPGASYQRRKGSLDLLHVIYDTLIYCPDSRQRKGYTPETATKLVDYARRLDFWEFFSVENTKSLIVCLLDGADEIQTSAADLLTKYHPCLPEETCCRLLRDSLSLCSSPRSHESQSGAVLCKYLFQKCVVEKGFKLVFHYDVVKSEFVVKTTDSVNNATCHFLQCLLDEINRCHALAEQNLVEASKKYPVHGLILAVTKCLTEVEIIWQQQQPSLFPLATHLVTCCSQVIDSMLEVMASVAGQEACPSFAEIGMALENILSENQADYSESTTLSPEYQFMLSCCWNNIKESCSCLGAVTNSLLACGQPVALEFVQKICDTFIKVLTKCRHKGVIEGTRMAFIRFCSALFLAPDGSVQQLPATVLTQVLLSLKNNVMTSSVTRRSAGLPIIIQAILVSEKKMKKTVLLTKAVEELFEISSLPLDSDSGLTDLPQVHGLNILNSLFGDASLSASLMGHISHTVILVIEMFGSPSWAIRNAATRLFSTLVTRMFGQRKEDVSCNTVTFQEFSSYYPELPHFIQDVLDEASQCDIGAIDKLDPRLFPVLTLLSCLKPMESVDSALNSTVYSIKEQVFQFIGSPVYQLRHLVAPAVVAMVTMADMATVARECLTLIPRPSAKLNCNKVHGLLLLVSKLLDNINSVSELRGLWIKLMEMRWIVEMPCLLVGLYAELQNRILDKYCKLSDRERITNLMLIILCPYNTHPSDNLPVGYTFLCEEVVKLLFKVWESTGRSCVPLAPLLLSGSNTDIRKICLECVKRQVESERLTQSGLIHLQGIVSSHLIQETEIPNTVLVLELITQLYLMIDKLEDEGIIWSWLVENKETTQKYTSLAAAVMPVIAIVVKVKAKDDDIKTVQPLLESLCCQIQSFGQDYNETKRHSAAASLQIAGECVLDLARILQLPWLQKGVKEVISACLTLVQDEDTGIRSQAAQFVSSITNISPTIQFPSIHSNICYEIFLEYIGRQFVWSTECCHFLTEQLYTHGSLPELLNQRTESRYQQLFDQEDNSFFAEKLYNSMCLHQILKGMIKTHIKSQDSILYMSLEKLAENLDKDLEVLLSAVEHVEKDSISNIFTDSTVLSSMCGLVLLADIVAIVTNCDHGIRRNLNFILEVMQCTEFPPCTPQPPL